MKNKCELAVVRRLSNCCIHSVTRRWRSHLEMCGRLTPFIPFVLCQCYIYIYISVCVRVYSIVCVCDTCFSGFPTGLHVQ